MLGKKKNQPKVGHPLGDKKTELEDLAVEELSSASEDAEELESDEKLDEEESEEEENDDGDSEASWSDDDIEEEGQLSVDVYQDRHHIIIKSTIAGVEPEDVDVSIDNDMVTIRGRRRRDTSIREEDYFYQECYWGSFSRSIILPVDILPDKVDATIRNGILTVILPKAKKKDISIKVKDKN